ncbi:hypothetical protein [Actinoplanes sp. NPDC051851]|uniref:alpha/beta hydrolase family esterase n=1 Tax=Actinoplanes sp. NPDC051851 TaxID=3154753 RepID=UPI003428C356
MGATMRHSIDVDGRTRTYTLVEADSEDLLLVFHGSKQDGAKHRAFTGNAFDALATAGVATVAYLDGYRGNWNDARRTSAFPARAENVDDVAFAHAVADQIKPRRVFAVGYSNGGQMVLRLMHETPALLSGAAVIAATMPEPDAFLFPDAPPAPMPLIIIHGTKDPITAYAGGEFPWWARKLFKVGGRSLSAPDTAAYFAGRNGIHAAPSTARLGTMIEQTSYASPGRPPVSLYTVHGGGHTIPGPRNSPAIMGRTSHDANTADLLADLIRAS